MDNVTGNSTAETEEEEDWGTSYIPRLAVWKTVIISAVLVLIIAGNLLVMVVVRKVRSLPPVSRVGMISLALSDLMVGMVYAPFALYMSTGKQPIIKVWCMLCSYLGIYFSAVSMCNMAGTSLDRFLTISLPLVYRKHSSTKKCVAILSIAWLFPALCFIPLLTTELKMKYFPDSLTCSIDFFHHYNWTIMMIAMVYGMCSVIIAFSNVRLYRIAIRHVKAIRKQDCNRDNPEAETTVVRRGGRRRSSVTHPTVSKILITVMVCFYTCWTPLMTYKVFTFVDRTDGPYGLGFTLVWIAMSHSFLNVVTYCIFSAEFRMGLKRLLECNRCHRRGGPPCKKCELYGQANCDHSPSRSDQREGASQSGLMLTCATYWKAKTTCFVSGEVVTVVKVVKSRVVNKSSVASQKEVSRQDRTCDVHHENGDTRNTLGETSIDRAQTKLQENVEDQPPGVINFTETTDRPQALANKKLT